MKSTVRIAVTGLAAVAAGFLADASAQTYPAKPVRLLVPYAAGGATDIVSRVLASRLTESLGQQFVVDNRPGGSAILATELLAKAPPDGYTLINANIAHGANPSLNAKLPYDTTKDFASVSLLALLPMVLLTHPSLPVKNVRDLVVLVKARPGQFNYASAGTGSANHLSMELFVSATGIDVTHVPYKGGGPAIIDLMGGQVPMMFITIPPALPHAKSGKVRVLAVSSAKRVPMLPEVPTVAESGVAGYDFNEWQAILAPAGTPANTIAKLNTEINRVLGLPEVKERITGLGAVVAGSTPEQLTAFIQAELTRWATVIKKTGIRTIH